MQWFSKTMQEEISLQRKISNLVSETFSCIRTVIAFGAQKQTIGKYEKLLNEHNKMTEQRLRASSVFLSFSTFICIIILYKREIQVYDALAQILFTELIFTAALCYGMWRVGNDNPGRLAAVNLFFV